MTVTAATLDTLGIDHAVFKRVRLACRFAAHGIDLDAHALQVSLVITNLRRIHKTGPGSASPAETRATRAETGAE